MDSAEEDRLLRSVALRNANTILLARQRAEEELVRAKDALERKTHELAHSVATMRATLEATTDGIVVTDGQGRVTGYNERYLRMWQLPRALADEGDHGALIEACAHRFADPAAFAARVAEIERGAAGDALDVLELADGCVYERASRIQFVDGAEVGRVWSFRDITERRRAEEAMRDESRVLDLLNRTGAVIASTLDVPRLLQAVSDAATQLSGAAFGAFFYDAPRHPALACTAGAGLGETQVVEACERLRRLSARTAARAQAVRSNDIAAELRAAGPALALRSWLAVPVVSRTGDAIGALCFGHPAAGVFSERSERLVVGIAAQAATAIDNARLYEEARRLADERERLFVAERAARADTERVSRMKDEFLATLSHELRTPLTAILGWSKVLMLKRGDAENLDRGLDAIARNARSQAQLIDDLLDMSRIISGKVRLEVQPTDLATVIEAALDSVRPSAEAKEIRLRVALDPRASPVQGDPDRLQQVAWNLLSNAVKFTPKGGTIDVLLERVHSHLRISVADTGIGIEPEFLPHVFDRFRQADSSTTRTHSGLGLGLSIVKQLVELHGGSVRAKSAGADRGATFVVELPLAARGDTEKAAGAQAAALDPESIHLDGVKVLVVDDEPDARELITQVLERFNAEVRTAASAGEALGIIDDLQPNVIVRDIGMPGQDGYEFIREVRRRPRASGGSTPAVALTAFARSEDRTRAMIAGYQMHIAKPIEPRELAATVGSLAGRIHKSGT